MYQQADLFWHLTLRTHCMTQTLRVAQTWGLVNVFTKNQIFPVGSIPTVFGTISLTEDLISLKQPPMHDITDQCKEFQYFFKGAKIFWYLYMDTYVAGYRWVHTLGLEKIQLSVFQLMSDLFFSM